MSRKPAALSASLVAVKGARLPTPEAPARNAATADLLALPDGTGDTLGAPLNFRVPASFRREFKVYAAQHGLKLNELLRRSFESYRRTTDPEINSR